MPTQEIVAVELTPDDVGDVSELSGLLDQIDAEVASLTAGGAYDGVVGYNVAADRYPAAALIIPPRATAVPSTAATTRRDRHITSATHGRMGWQHRSGYNRRRLIEAAIYRYKAIIGRPTSGSNSDQSADGSRDRMQRAQPNDEFRHACVGSDHLMLDPLDRHRRPAIHAPMRLSGTKAR